MLKRKKRIELRLRMWDLSGKVVFDDRLERLRLPDEVILSMSVEFFSDPEPCQIHRGACMSRAFAEIEMACAQRRAIGELPGRIKSFFGLYDVHSLCVLRGEED